VSRVMLAVAWPSWFYTALMLAPWRIISEAAYTGLRPCEFVALKVGRLDLLVVSVLVRFVGGVSLRTSRPALRAAAPHLHTANKPRWRRRNKTRIWPGHTEHWLPSQTGFPGWLAE
jgi:hypothetical protein